MAIFGLQSCVQQFAQDTKPSLIRWAFLRSGADMQPSKELVRQYMQRQAAEHRPPPDMKQIRRELGWDLVEQERKQQAGRR